MKTRTSGNVQHPLRPTLFELLDEKIALTLITGIPIDQFVPLVDETLDVLLLVMIGIPNFYRISTELLFLCNFCLFNDRCSLTEYNKD